MKIRSLSIVIACLLSISLILWWNHRPSSASIAKNSLTKISILPPSVITSCGAIEISWKQENKTLTFSKTDLGWQIDNYFDLPVNMSRLQSMVSTLQQSKVSRKIGEGNALQKELSIGDTVITFLDPSNQAIHSINIGKASQSKEQFISINSQEVIYAINQELHLPFANKLWRDPQPLGIDPAKTQSISVESWKGSFSISRAALDKNFHSSEKNKLDQNKVSKWLSDISLLTYDELLTADKLNQTEAKNFPYHITIKSFSGEETIATFYQEPEKTLLNQPSLINRLGNITSLPNNLYDLSYNAISLNITPPRQMYLRLEASESDKRWKNSSKKVYFLMTEQSARRIQLSIADLR